MFDYAKHLRHAQAALSLLGRWRRVADAHPELIDARQKELFHDQV